MQCGTGRGRWRFIITGQGFSNHVEATARRQRGRCYEVGSSIWIKEDVLVVISRELLTWIVSHFLYHIYMNNTPGTAGGPGGRERMLAVKSKKIAQKSTNFRIREIPRSG